MRTNTAYSEQRDQKGIVRQAREREREAEIERETDRTRKCRLNQNACKNIVFSHTLCCSLFFRIFLMYSSLHFALCILHFALHLPVACAQLKLASASSGSSSATPASISLIQIVCARQRRLLRCNCIVIQFKICV